MALDREAAVVALRRDVADPLGLSPEAAAAAVLALSTEKMVGAIDEITVNQGIDPSQAILIGGGGAAGLNIVAVGRRLGCTGILIPEVGAALSAAGALMSDLSSDYARIHYTTSADFDFAGVSAVLGGLAAQCRDFAEGPGAGSAFVRTSFFVEARYAHQIWEIEVPMPDDIVADAGALDRLVERFHETHRGIFEIEDRHSSIEFITWRARVSCGLNRSTQTQLAAVDVESTEHTREIYFQSTGWTAAEVVRFESMPPHATVSGPAIVESSFTTVVIDPGAVASKSEGGSLRVEISAA